MSINTSLLKCGTAKKKGASPSSFGKNSLTEKQWITDLPAGLRGRVIFGKGNEDERTDKQTGCNKGLHEV